MLPKWRNNLSTAHRLLWFAILLTYGLPAYAELKGTVTGLSLQNMLVTLAAQIPQLMSMVTAIAYVLGFYMVIMGIVGLKHAGEMRSMMSQEHSLKGPVILLAIGALLIYLPTSVNVGMSTFWTDPNPYGYSEYSDEWSQFINVCYLIVQFIGTIAFIRGLIVLSHTADRGAHGSFSRGLTYIIGGVLCINIYQTVQVIFATFGIGVS
ncbi:MAG: hypothetical protein EPO11_07015 [Gammaproteobacteria bacterium]|nr:MAG: hypothetical protein EPO11_07015 [Gammaproteobacteria bacterium]